jgi:hypothetical protein
MLYTKGGCAVAYPTLHLRKAPLQMNIFKSHEYISGALWVIRLSIILSNIR